MAVSKADLVLDLFFQEPTKHWHFDEVVKTTKISRPQASLWLKTFCQTLMVKKNKTPGKMPYYTSNYTHPAFQIRKRMRALELAEKSGLLEHLSALPKAKAVILFGSFSRWDWYKDSDIDLFILGSDEGIDLRPYYHKMGREIEVFNAKDENELKTWNQGLVKNILRGFWIKGEII